MTDPQVIVNLGTGGADLNGQNGSTTSADSNDARFLDWPGDNAGNYVYLPGVAGNYLSVPDEAALNITGDIDIRVQVAMDDWTPAATQTLLSKGTWSTTAAFRLEILANARLRLFTSPNGVNNVNTTSTVGVSVTDFNALWVRAVRDMDNGAGGNTTQFFTSDDGVTWTQLGTDVISSGTTSINVSDRPVDIGAVNSGGSQAVAGKVYRAQILDGIDGTTVLDVDTSVISSGSATSFTALTGQTVTINRSTSGRKSVAVVSPVWLFGTDDYMEVADNALLNFDASDDFTLLACVRTWNTPVNNQRYVSKFDVGTLIGYDLRNNGTTQNGIAVVGDGATKSDVAVASSSGTFRLYGFVVDRSLDTLTAFTDSAFATTPTSLSGVASFQNNQPLRIGVRSDAGSSYADAEIASVALFRRALTQQELSEITSYYQARLS